ncbi:hypothetical protein ES703_88110 [subsurface metagenome]
MFVAAAYCYLPAVASSDIAPDNTVNDISITIIRAIQSTAVAGTKTNSCNHIVRNRTIDDIGLCVPIDGNSSATQTGCIVGYKAIGNLLGTASQIRTAKKHCAAETLGRIVSHKTIFDYCGAVEAVEPSTRAVSCYQRRIAAYRAVVNTCFAVKPIYSAAIFRCIIADVAVFDCQISLN